MKGTLSRGTQSAPRDETPTLRELGISKKTSARSQQLAGLPDEVYEAIRAGDVTLNQALRGQRREVLKAGNMQAAAVAGSSPYREAIERDGMGSCSSWQRPKVSAMTNLLPRWQQVRSSAKQLSATE